MKKFLLYLIVATMMNNMAYGWEDDVSKNTQITPTGLTYIENDIKTNKNGMTYVFMLCGGAEISMRLQIVNPEGERLLSRGGDIISQEPNKSWFGLNQYIELDKDGNAFIGVQDYRNNVKEEKLTYTIYKYDQSGNKLLDGVTLNDGIGHALETGLSMCATDDGCICAYQYTDEEQGSDFIIVEKISNEGKSLWKKILYQSENFTSPYPFVTDAGNGRVLLLITTGNGKIIAQVIKSDGTLEKEDFETVYTEGFASSKIWEAMQVEELPGNKTLVTIVDGRYHGRMLVINGDGSIGLDGSNKGAQLNDGYFASGTPAVTYNEQDDTYTCVFKMFDTDHSTHQSLWLGKYSGKDGNIIRNELKELVAFQTDYQYGYYVLRNAGDGRSALFYMKMDNSNYNDVKAYMQVIESDGSILSDPVPFTTAASSKQTLRVSELTDGQFVAAWDDKRNSQMSLFMQNIKFDGTTGISCPETTTAGKDVKTEYFSSDGRKLNSLQKGLNIIRTTDGNTMKTVKIMK